LHRGGVLLQCSDHFLAEKLLLLLDVGMITWFQLG